METNELQAALSLPPQEAVSKLKNTSYPLLPKWADLEKQYNPLLHEIMTNKTRYPEVKNDNGSDDFKRTPMGLQKLAVNRISQSMFTAPVTRKYAHDNSEESVTASAVIEQLYATDNYINAENIERAKQLNASCQIATIWRVYDKLNVVNGLETKYKLAHSTYSPMNGYTLYAQNDNNGELVVLSIGYTDTDGNEHLDVYTPTQILLYATIKGKWQAPTIKTTTFISVVYATIKEPVWLGNEGTMLVESIEELISYQGMYIKKNTVPTFTIDWGDIENSTKIDTNAEKSSDVRRLIQVGKGGAMKDVTWPGASASIKEQYAVLRDSFFEQIQTPDISFRTLLNSNTSFENKELVFFDAKAKAKDLGGEWERMFYDELNIIKEFAKIMFPKLAKAIDGISISSTVNPYSLNTKKETAEYIALAGDNMSRRTKVRLLNEVQDIDAELKEMDADTKSNNNF